MFCTNCGNLLKDGALFCSKCGRKIKRSQPAAASPDFNQTENVIVSGTTTDSASEMSGFYTVRRFFRCNCFRNYLAEKEDPV